MKKMKKYSKFLLGVLFLTLLGGCGSEREQAVKKDSTLL